MKTIHADWYFILPSTLIWLAALAITAWDFLNAQQAVYRFDAINLVGACLLVTGLTLRLIARRTLARHFSYGLRLLEQHQLVTHGIYRHIRHPAYTGDLLFWFGVTLLFRSGYGFLVMLLLMPCFIYRTRIEENLLIARFGPAYRAYQQTTKKFLPFLF